MSGSAFDHALPQAPDLIEIIGTIAPAPRGGKPWHGCGVWGRASAGLDARGRWDLESAALLPVPATRREVYLGERYALTPAYRWAELRLGQAVPDPAVLEP